MGQQVSKEKRQYTIELKAWRLAINEQQETTMQADSQLPLEPMVIVSNEKCLSNYKQMPSLLDVTIPPQNYQMLIQARDKIDAELYQLCCPTKQTAQWFFEETVVEPIKSLSGSIFEYESREPDEDVHSSSDITERSCLDWLQPRPIEDMKLHSFYR